MRGSGVRIPLAAPPSGFSLPRRKLPTVGGLDASILIDAGFVTAGIRLADAVERMPVPHETDPPSDERALGELAAVPANAKAPLADPASLAGLPPGDDLVRDPKARASKRGPGPACAPKNPILESSTRAALAQHGSPRRAPPDSGRGGCRPAAPTWWRMGADPDATPLRRPCGRIGSGSAGCEPSPW